MGENSTDQTKTPLTDKEKTNLNLPEITDGRLTRVISPNAHFTVKSEAVKELLVNSGSNIQDEQITVDVNL